MEGAGGSKKKVAVSVKNKVTGKGIMAADGDETRKVYAESKIAVTDLERQKEKREFEKREFARLKKMYEEAILAGRNKKKLLTELEEDNKRKMHHIMVLERRLTAHEMDLKQKDEDLTARDLLNNVLLTKARFTDDELKEVTKALEEYFLTGDTKIKRMSEIDDEAFIEAVRKTIETIKVYTESKIDAGDREKLKEREDELKNLEALRESEKQDFARRERMNEEAGRARENAWRKRLKQSEGHKVKELAVKEAAIVNLREKIMEHEAEIKRLKDVNKNAKEELDGQKKKQEAMVEERCRSMLLMQEAEDAKRKLQDRVNDLEEMLAALESDLKAKDEELTAKVELNQVLITKERNSNEELQEVRKELIKCLKECEEDASTGDIGIKRMGVIDDEALRQALRRTGQIAASENFAVVSSIWQGRLSDPHWYPFKTVQVPGTGAHQLVVDTDDILVTILRSHLGERACEIVMTAFKELIEYNSSGRFPEPELWNYKENRKATLREVASFLRSQRKQLKRKRPAN